MNYFEDQLFTQESIEGLLPFKAFEFINCTFSDIDFSNIHLSLSKFLECKFHQCNFSNSIVKNTTFREVKFHQCKLIGINWTESAILNQAEFNESLLDFCVFQMMKLNQTKFNYSSLKEVDFYEAKLIKASFVGSNLELANFNKADLTEADFRTATRYSIDIREVKIKKAKFSLPEVMTLLQAFNITIE